MRVEALDDDVDPFDDEPGGSDPLDAPMGGGVIELDVAAPSPAAPAFGGGGVDFGDDLEDPLLAGAGDIGLELDQGMGAVAEAAAAAPAVALEVAAPQPRRFSSTPPSEAEPDPVRVAEVAGYGVAPTGVVSAVMYAVSVLSRRPTLRAAHAEARRKRSVASRKADEALAALGQALHARKAQLDLAPLGEVLAAVDRAHRSASARGSEQAQAEADADARRKELARDLTQAEAEANPYRDRETKLRTQLEARQHDKKRAEAQQKRAEIELRNASQAGDTGRIEMLTSERDARAAELKLAHDKIGELTAELGQVRRELASRLGRVAAITEAQRQAEHTLRRATGVHGASAAEAEKQLHLALRTFAEHAIKRGLASAEPALLDKAEKAQQALASRAAEEKLYARAEDSWDRPGFWRGASVLGVASALVLAMIVVAVAL